MSETPVEIVAVKSVTQHPNADRLEIVKVLDTQLVAPLDCFHVGQSCVYFPPDIMIPESVADALGVKNYLKHAVYPGDSEKSQCRVGAIRLRGVPSFGFGLPLDERLGVTLGDVKVGDDVSEAFSAEKYQPPPKMRSSDAEPDHPAFHKYTNIQHYYRYASALPTGTPVRITEKIHGSNSRVGVIDGVGMAGSHNVRVKMRNANHDFSPYWLPMTDNMIQMMEFISRGVLNVIVFGEIYGSRVQSMDYGLPLTGHRVFDISVDGDYLDWEDIKTYCDLFEIATVPVLYEGPFRPELIDQYISGPTTLASPENICCDFKGREGIVITPLEETFSPVLGGRLILKAVSPDYYAEVK
ncbi:MAG: hypothetical protein AMS22_12875 [Thiotrichales bacterium SG8_50]|nr:MAG: hypothetical protein AMS22_12875 [Thiotrichales bacterium SG8_50]